MCEGVGKLWAADIPQEDQARHLGRQPDPPPRAPPARPRREPAARPPQTVIVDANCAIGHWPFRRLWTTTAEGLLRLLDRAGIERAIVSHTHAVFYRSPHESNAELLRAPCAPTATASSPSPASPRTTPAGGTTSSSASRSGTSRGCASTPATTATHLAGDPAAELLAEAERYRLPVSVGCAFEDPRQRHPLDTAPDVNEHDIGPAAAALSRGALPVHQRPPDGGGHGGAPRPPPGQRLLRHQRLHRAPLGRHRAPPSSSWARRLLLGTHAPFKYPQVGLLRVQTLDTDPATRAADPGRERRAPPRTVADVHEQQQG